MRICVFGAGAVGGHIAAKLAAAGHDVSVVARGAHLAAIRDKGIRLVHGEETITGRVRTGDPGLQDFVFVTLKANALGGFADAAAPLLGANTGVVFAQNGIPWWYGIGLSSKRPKPPDLSRLDPGQKLKNLLKPQQVIGCVVYSANEVREPGVVVNNVPGNNMLVVGEAGDRDSEQVRTLRKILGEADLASPATEDIRASVWAKLVQNLGTATVCTLAGVAIREVRANPELAQLAASLSAEGKAIARGHGVDTDAAPARPSGGQSAGLINHKPSMLQDLERGRPMEVEALHFAPLAFARATGVAAPTLAALVPLLAFKAGIKIDPLWQSPATPKSQG